MTDGPAPARGAALQPAPSGSVLDSGVDTTSSGRPEGTTYGLAGILALAFLGGLILNLMPCVFPVLGIKILGFVQQAGADRAKVRGHGLAFAAGVLASF